MLGRDISISQLAVCALLCALVIPASAGAAPPASFTTDSTGTAVNKNQYLEKCDVYLNGGPNNAALPAGSYTFFVLAPGAQANPNGSNLLSTDTNANRTFTSTSNGTITYNGTHPTGTDGGTGKKLISLCDPSQPSDGYDNTPSPGGVYILAICPTSNQTPSGCKYDAFKVTGGATLPPSDLTAVKTAAGSYTKTYGWSLTKSVDKTYVQAGGGTATFNYVVSVTKSAGVDSGFTVAGAIQVFNPNDDDVTGVSVTDAIGGTACTVSGDATTIAAGSSETFNYTCRLPNATAATTGTNVASISWNQASIGSPGSSMTASAPFDFSAAPTVVGNCTTVTDTFDGTAGTLGSPCNSAMFNYSRTVPIPPVGCRAYTNTASESVSGTTGSKTVTVCRTNANGFTIGFWSNKNGQDRIKSNATAWCLALKPPTYSNVLTGFPATCTATSLAKYVADVIAAANASDTGAPMFKAQFLATALNVLWTPALGSTGVVVPTSIEASGCMTVSDLLAYGNANYAMLSADKLVFMAVKDIYDHINNNNRVTCVVAAA